MTNMTRMREVLLAASICGAVAACATVKDGHDDPIGEGDAAEGVQACTRASDCAAGVACDVTAGVCAPGVLTIEPETLVIGEDRWWTNTSSPAIGGGLGRMAKSVQVTAGERSVLAAVEGARWSAVLPDGAIVGADTQVVVTMVDATGGHVELQQRMALDTSPPLLTLAPSTVRDERGDAIDFSTGEPVHTHGGAEVDLGAEGCPVVARHGYLMGASEPVFGAQSARNPLVWNVQVADTQIHSVEYRVRDSELGTIYLDWTTATPSTAGMYPIELLRDEMPALATQPGLMSLDVRARDWSGTEATWTWCWTNLPLAAPLGVEQATQATGPEALASWSLTTLTPVSRLLGLGRGGAIAEQRITQYTAEPVHLRIDASRPTGRFTRSVVAGYVPVVVNANDDCTVVNYCSNVHQTAATPVTTSGVLGELSTSVEIIDELSGLDVTATVLTSGLPPRVDGPPRSYRVRVFLNQVADLRPSAGHLFGEHVVGGVWFTGPIPGVPWRSCTTRYTDTSTGKVYCRRYTSWEYIHALDAATLELDAVTLSVKAAVSATARAHALAYVSPSTFVVPAWTWNAGDEDLPGPY